MEQNKKSLENLDLSDIQNISKDISGAALEELSLKNLDKNLQILKEVGVAEICKATRIASKNIHSILEKRYESLSRVHARGFIQILEREYKIDLSAWMKEFDKVCVFKGGVGEEKNQETSPEETAKKPLKVEKVELDYSINQANTSLSKKSSKWKPFVIVLGVIVIILVVVIIQNSSSLKEERGQESAIKSGTKNTFNEANPTEENKPETTPKLEEKHKEQDKPEKKAIKENPNTIYIIPKKDVWVEVVDLDEKKNSFQKVFKKNYPLETKNHRLLLRFGHGHLSLKNNHQEQDYNDSKTRRFLYEPNKGLTLINEAQYKEFQQ
ncbi:sialidase [Helicobacter pylori]|uniref:sialidase n=1 Tax=Helicobacter pylori TaxID=210 RepID=UPI0015E7BF8D|nr:sialidase [Helicobacter pylori]